MTDDGPGHGPGHNTWTVQRVLGWTRDYFADKGIDTPRLDAEVLLAGVLGYERITLYTQFDQPLSAQERASFRAQILRRAAREPVAYITGKREFFSREFAVTKAVLVPRPETEHLVEAVLGWVAAQAGITEEPRILDLGTGSGNIAVTLACELPAAQLVATDISAAALEIARRNAEAHAVAERVRFVEGDLFAALSSDGAPDDSDGRFDVIVTNPPYVETPSRDALMPEVRDYEPALALFAGEDGCDILDRLCAGVGAYLATPGLFVCEMGATQHDHVVAALEQSGSWTTITTLHDLAGHQRGVAAQR